MTGFVRMDMRRLRMLAGVVLGTLPALSAVHGQVGIDWVTIGAPGNPGVNLPVMGGATVGSIDYTYRIARTELTTAQYLDFVNTFAAQPGSTPFFLDGAQGLPHGDMHWGAVGDSEYAGPGVHWRLPADDPNAGNIPVIGLSWRDAAVFCNWLHNGGTSDPASLVTGAYDSTTWGVTYDEFWNPIATDAPERLPGARYWIPTFSEWTKAAFYDPNRYGPGQGGWWQYNITSDTAPVEGPPGVGQTAGRYAWQAGYVGMYPDVTTPWGLLDTSGSGREWTETLLPNGLGTRMVTGSRNYWYEPLLDRLGGADGNFPSASFGMTVRLATTVPSTSVVVAFLLAGSSACVRRRR